MKTRKKDKCPPSVSARVVGPTKGRSGALRPVGSSPRVLRGGDRFFLPSRPGSPGGASNSSRWANGEANSGSRDLASRDVSKRKGPQLEELYRALVDFTLRATDNLVLER